MKSQKLSFVVLLVIAACAVVLLVPRGASASGMTYYLNATSGSDSNPGTSTAPWKTLQKATSTMSSGDKVILASGIYRVNSPFAFGPGGSASALTRFRAAAGARPIITDMAGLPPQITFRGDFIRLDGLWLGGSLPPNGRSVGTGGSLISRGIELVNNTIFGYETGILIGSSEYLTIRGNRILNTGYGRYSHAMYLSGGCCVGQLSQHVIVDNNVIVGNGSGGYGITVYNSSGLQPHNFIITRNLIAGMWWGSSTYGSDNLIANNFYWKETGVPGAINSTWGLEADDTHSLYLNNVMETGGWMVAGYGFPPRPSWTEDRFDHNAHQRTGKPTAAMYAITGTNTISMTAGNEFARYGVSSAQLDAAILALTKSFSQSPGRILTDTTIEANLALLKLKVPSTSPLYQRGKPWFGQLINIGSDATAPADASGFWTAFRALGLKEYDRFGNPLSSGTPTPTGTTSPVPVTVVPTKTPTLAATNTPAPSATIAPTLTPPPTLPASGNVITLNPALTFQKFIGWEATAQAGEQSASFPYYRSTLMNLAANDLGINRIRLELHPVSTANMAPDLDLLDGKIDNIVVPLRSQLSARGETLWVNLCYVAFNDTTSLKTKPQLYAQYVLSVFQHMQAKYGFVPDSVEIQLEPDTIAGGQWTPLQLAYALVATGNLLKTNGYLPEFIAPSTMSMSTAVSDFDGMVGVSGVLGYLTEISFHRYTGASLQTLQSLAQRAQANNLRTSMLEHISSGYSDLHQDLQAGNVSAWQQYVLAYPTVDNGAQYYTVNTSNPTSPVVSLSSTGKYLRQYMRFIRRGATRVDAQSNINYFDPVAFVNANGKYVVVVKSTFPGLPSDDSFSVNGLPAGTYGIKYTTPLAYNVDLPDVTLSAGAVLTTRMPGSGVITIYQQ